MLVKCTNMINYVGAGGISMLRYRLNHSDQESFVHRRSGSSPLKIQSTDTASRPTAEIEALIPSERRRRRISVDDPKERSGDTEPASENGNGLKEGRDEQRDDC